MSTTPVATPEQTLAIGVTTDVGSIAQALAAIFKMVDDILAVVNSPAMLAARKNADVARILATYDLNLKEAQATDDLTIVDKESSG